MAPDPPPEIAAMSRLASGLARFAEAVAAAMMAAMFLTFILQIAVRYTARSNGCRK